MKPSFPATFTAFFCEGRRRRNRRQKAIPVRHKVKMAHDGDHDALNSFAISDCHVHAFCRRVAGRGLSALLAGRRSLRLFENRDSSAVMNTGHGWKFVGIVRIELVIRVAFAVAD